MTRTPLCLVVDDSRVIRRVAKDILADLNLRTAEAEHGLDAVEFCRNTVPDFVLLDWNMPEMDGITCLRALRAMNLEPRPTLLSISSRPLWRLTTCFTIASPSPVPDIRDERALSTR